MSSFQGPSNFLSRTLQSWGPCRDFNYFDSRGLLENLPVIPILPNTPVPSSEQHYTIHAPVQVVYDAYRCAKPHHMWPADRIEFCFCTLLGGDKRYTPNDEIPPMDLGMQIFCDLKVKPLGRFLSLMVGVEITAMKSNEEIRYDYLEGSVTRGFNSMRFSQTRDDNGRPITRVHHYSEYQATSKQMELFFPIMQPLLHVGFVNALHHGMKQRIEA